MNTGLGALGDGTNELNGATLTRWPTRSAKNVETDTLKFRRYAAVAWLVEAGASNRAGVSWAAVFPVIRARRKAMIMSSTDTCRLCRYHGAAWRRELRSAAGRPARSYHRTRMVRLARPRGVVRSTAAGSRFWASPAPRRSLPSLIDCSTDQREAYLATICPPGVVRSVLARARVQGLVSSRSRTRITRTGVRCRLPHHRQLITARSTVSVVP